MPAPDSDSGELPPAGRSPIGVGSGGEALPLQRVPPMGIINSPVPRGAINMCMAGGSGGGARFLNPHPCPPAHQPACPGAVCPPEDEEAGSILQSPASQGLGHFLAGQAVFALGPGELMRC